MQGEHLDALVTAAADGITFDGLVVEPDGDGYVVTVAGEEHTAADEEALRAVASDYPAFVSNWYVWHATAPQKEDRWAYLRWIEDAEKRTVPERYGALSEGVTATWGELRITARLEDGGRRYDLRHVDDAETPATDLDTYDDPLEARTLAKHDDDGKYRPLKTAPTLRTGWQFTDLGPADLVQTVEFFYPATIANWHREREGELDVNHWRETMERQSGIYGVVQTWDRGQGHEHVDWVAEACCDDSQCLKRREWQYDDETDLDVDGGHGAFPCREPCSLVVSAARRWTKLEGEQTQTYEFELTPSEKEQVERIVDAVADGETEEIREADVYDGANRYRTRFLRAKLFDEDGNLCGVETDDD
jgi:hypothetical protein